MSYDLVRGAGGGRPDRARYVPVCAWCGLESSRERNGTPAAIQVDNGTEFTIRVVDQVGVSESGGAAFNRTRQADVERAHRELQREVLR